MDDEISNAFIIFKVVFQKDNLFLIKTCVVINIDDGGSILMRMYAYVYLYIHSLLIGFFRIQFKKGRL